EDVARTAEAEHQLVSLGAHAACLHVAVEKEHHPLPGLALVHQPRPAGKADPAPERIELAAFGLAEQGQVSAGLRVSFHPTRTLPLVRGYSTQDWTLRRPKTA